jgi:biotin synthase
MKIHAIFNRIDNDQALSEAEVVRLLNTQDIEIKELYEKADEVRAQYMGNDIFLRGIIEFSNYCKKDCNYCGIRRGVAQHVPTSLHRYRMNDNEIIATCKNMMTTGQTTVVLQSGEDPYYTKERFGALLRKIKTETKLAITVSVGERDRETYAYWKKMGMDRYLLRFETSDVALFKTCHPDDDLAPRLECLRTLQHLGVQTGSGFLIGLPNETIDQLARDILFCTELQLDMIGVGPFIPHPDTPFGKTQNSFDKEVYFKVVAILRLLNKDAHIPSTTAFDAIDPDGRNLLLQRGANVFMPNATPKQYRKDYQLYPGKPCVDESADDCSACVKMRVFNIGRTIGKGPGHSIRKKK